MKHQTRILKIKGNDEAKELDFEVRHQMSLTTQERFEAMIDLSLQLLLLARKHGYSRTPKIVKRS